MKIKVRSFFETIIALCILLDCESVWKWMHHSGYFKLALVSCFILSVVILFIKNGAEIYKRDNELFGFLFLYLTVFLIYNAFVNYSHIIDSMQFVATIVLMSLYFKDNLHIERIMNRCSKILCILACLSLFFWLFGSVLHIFSPAQELTVYVNNVPKVRQSYFYLHYEIQREELLCANIYRNTGIFYEGPKYTLLLAILLSYELFISLKPSYKRSIIFTITVLSTMAMTGIYAIGLIWSMFLFTKYNAKTTKGLMCRIVLIAALLLIEIQTASYFEGMFELKTSTTSYITRIDNYQAGFKAWKEHIIMGAGYLNMDTIIAHYSSFRLNDIGYSNSVFKVLAQGGLYLAIIYIGPMLKAFVSGIKEKNGKMLSFLSIYVCLFITTSFQYNYINFITLLILWFGMPKNKQYLSVKKNGRRKLCIARGF